MEISENYLTNRVTGEIGQAAAIYFPTSQEDVVTIIQNVRKNQQKLITIGGHTGLSGATFPDANQVLMSLEKMNRILDLDVETMTLTVEAGVTIADISAYLAETPYFYAPDPGSK